MQASFERLTDGYRLANDLFEAVISIAGKTVGIAQLNHRGSIDRQKIEVKEQPLTVRLATDAQRIDILSWSGHSGSGSALPPEEDWGYQLKLHEQPPGGNAVQRLNEIPLGGALYTDTYYPGYYWYRQMVALPKEWDGKPVVFVLGGCDRYDWRAYWVYLNGQRIGEASYDDTYLGPWHETPRYVLKPGAPGYAHLKLGQPNLLAVQARRLDRRTPGMRRLDLERYSGQSLLVDQYVSGGEPTRDVTGFTVSDHSASNADGIASVELVMTHPTEALAITARYWLNPNEAVLNKRIVVHNMGQSAITLLEADVMSFTTGTAQPTGGGQGWPVRIGEDWFAGVCHPAGIARYGKDGVRLQVVPGATLDPAHTHDCVSKTVVIGVGNGRRAFADYLQLHGRRKPQFLNMFSLYGLCEIATSLYDKIELTEPLLLKNIDQLTALQGRGIKFDYYCIDTGWNDPRGELKTFHPANFPQGSDRSFKAIHGLGMKPLLWISPAQGPAAFRFDIINPHLQPEDNVGASSFLCMAAARWRNMLREGMLYQIKTNGVRGFKLDEVAFYCGRSNHGHLPNKYGVEATLDAFIDTLDQCQAECPDLLVMLYWRFMSPWWLLHADTIYQRGLLMEGSTPSPLPSRITRQSVTVSLDQGHDWNWDTMPLIGQDSLGVWLSNTRWASFMGAEGWREAWIMDFVRGNMMHQLWGDLGLLKPADVTFMEAIAKWTAQNPDLLKHPRRILGSPWTPGPYGYACCEGDRGVIVINNAQLPNETVRIALDEHIGLKPGTAFDVRWIYKNGSVTEQTTQRVEAGKELEIELGSFEACMADIRIAGADSNGSPPTRPSAAPRSIPIRPLQTSYTALNWYNPADQKRLALVVNNRTVATRSPEVLQASPDRSDERDRDIVKETLTADVVLEPLKIASKLLVTTRLDRDGIAWHCLAPFEIIHITAVADGKSLPCKVTPNRWHEEAGGWSWVLHEFDLPPGITGLTLQIDAVHPKTVTLTTAVWHNEA